MTVDCRPMLVAIIVLWFTAVLAASEQKAQTPSGRDTPDKDYSTELPRFPMKTPAESLRAIVARPGFHVELVAAEPMVRSPVAIDFDEDGRLHVAEFPEYNQYE